MLSLQDQTSMIQRCEDERRGSFVAKKSRAQQEHGILSFEKNYENFKLADIF